ncbi:hypothetical protein OV203_46915 [Nannocystis sp. ILAH1]|uniref:hypothetical protein n=1 Tax=unclassified Nannocystis TaxID=2627009 RepID=UPI00226F075B|nr:MULTISPECIES: hypothetical protein [unclassified Nannocystis]MCY0994748.1 hypothetical protein [Nannocystis sp. ILAH1]MCY1065382.1 hypothetical protein [Nannocystis sp. RBIL2]
MMPALGRCRDCDAACLLDTERSTGSTSGEVRPDYSPPGWNCSGRSGSPSERIASNAPGGCNDGFLREDALLMVTLISNTYDTVGDSKGTPGSWAASAFAAKHDDPESIVLLNIGDTMVPGCHDADRLCQLVKQFPYELNTEVWADGTKSAQATSTRPVACSKNGYRSSNIRSSAHARRCSRRDHPA